MVSDFDSNVYGFTFTCERPSYPSSGVIAWFSVEESTVFSCNTAGISATFTLISTLERPSAPLGVTMYSPFTVITCDFDSNVYGFTFTCERPS